MMDGNTGAILRHLRQLSAEHGAENLSDRELVERYASGRDEAAFAALVRRHGPMVWRVCLDVLKHVQDAEDAFQAAFLVLARRAATIRQQASVASWLHRVAYHAALEARASASRRPMAIYGDVAMPQAEPLAEVSRREQLAILHDELSRLGDKYRAPLVLCYLEDKTQDEGARQLAWSICTFRRRLDQARKRLQRRLQRRGVALSVMLTAGTLAQPASSAALPAGLVPATVRAAGAFAARSAAVGCTSTKAAALAEAVLRATAIAQLKSWAVLAAVCGTLLAATGILVHQAWVGTIADAAPADGPVAARLGLTPAPAPLKSLLASGSMDATILLWQQTDGRRPTAPRPETLSPQQLEDLWNQLASADAERAHRAIWSLADAPGQAVSLLEARLRPAAVEEPQGLRPLRAVEVLEQIGTPEAHRLLRTLAASTPETQGAAEVRAALLRLDRRRAATP